AALLPELLSDAADWRYEQAVRAADDGDLDRSRDHLERALGHDPGHARSTDALASLTPSLLPEATPGLAAYRGGVSASADRRWLAAERRFTEAIAANDWLLPARSGLHDARMNLAESAAHAALGRAAFDERRMGPAIASLRKSLSVWPGHTEAGVLLKRAEGQLAEAENRFAQANDAAGRSQWDRAITEADAGLAIDRSHRGLGELREALPGRAAQHHARLGDGQFSAGDLDGAHSAYRRSLSYESGHEPSQIGLSAIYIAWGEAEERAERFGAALLNYTRAEGYASTERSREGVARMRAAVRDRLALAVAITVEGNSGGDIDPRRLDAAIDQTLVPYESLGLRLDEPKPTYEVRMSIRLADIDLSLDRTANRSKRYTTQERQHNPEYDRVLLRLRAAERDYDRACRSYHRAARHGYDAHHHRHDAHFRHHYDGAYGARLRVDRLRRELACTPRTITITRQHLWDYRVETYTKSGELDVRAHLIDAATGKTLATQTHEAFFSQTDERVLNPNPIVGVIEDRLTLANDATVRSVLTRDLASAAGPWSVNAAIQHRLTELDARLDRLVEAGRSAEAIETRVDAAALVGLSDPEGFDEAIEGLAARYTR
ncbi:MAG: hypothetical protein ACPGYV_13505, partial [Phycisphaeraceae bacterium]